jgi:hypothetical protein
MLRRLEGKVNAAATPFIFSSQLIRQVVCVTGASGAIGAEIVRSILAQGKHPIFLLGIVLLLLPLSPSLASHCTQAHDAPSATLLRQMNWSHSYTAATPSLASCRKW